MVPFDFPEQRRHAAGSPGDKGAVDLCLAAFSHFLGYFHAILPSPADFGAVETKHSLHVGRYVADIELVCKRIPQHGPCGLISSNDDESGFAKGEYMIERRIAVSCSPGFPRNEAGRILGSVDQAEIKRSSRNLSAIGGQEFLSDLRSLARIYVLDIRIVDVQISLERFLNRAGIEQQRQEQTGD